ncbi:serine/threonine protein phosphatase PrpC [Arthrobacter sp. B2I5]|uniref:PP2C family protein-serine/threonine phosphatase n=1 Tax=Arthrobacter sp. B2I5 TaxID=3042266 RepID=UPI00277E0F7A|nr:PP2C family serine/threonine-protein phosphatase [Arthrobacter sp. B2I5]MDQ0827911.1 serine/threonine protein phosphatase PrpC [Arthrobacter sp. B2I5]
MAEPENSATGSSPAQRPLIMRFAARSDVGRIRSKNDDSAYAGRHLAVVADGMGGHAGGDVASAATVLDMIHLDSPDHGDEAGTILADEIQTANSLLSELVHINPKLAGMGTTVTALLLADGKLHFAHIGDSRAYRLRDGEFKQVSVDHTFVQRLIDEGRLRPEEAETHPHKNVLMRVLGDVDASPELDLDTLDARPGDRWLLCSDGLNYVAAHAVERTVRETHNLHECAETLVQLTLEAGSPDNVTVVMVDIVEETPDDVSTAAVEIVPPVQGSKPAAAAAGAAGPATAASSIPGDGKEAAKAGSDPEDAGQHPGPEKEPVDGGAKEGETGSPDPGSTDPHLGEHLSAEVLREELASRPHELVGAAAAAAEFGSIPTVAGRTVARRAATLLTHKAEPAGEPEDTLPALRPRRWVAWSVAAAVLVVVAVGLWLGYAWTQTRYYVGEFDSRVAIYNGVSQRLGPIQLSSLETVTEIRMDSLPPFSQQRVRQTVPANDLYDAQRIVKNLELTGTTSPEDECPKPSASPSGSTAPSASAAPPASEAAPPAPASDAPAPAPSPAPSGASPSPTPTITCEAAK